MTKRSRKSDELDAALRAEPDYQELVRLLKRQAPAQKARTERWLTKQAEEEEGPSMTTDKKALDSRIIALRDHEHLSFAKIAARLQAEGHEKVTAGSVRKRYERAEKSPAKKKITTPRKAIAPLPAKDFAPIPPEWIEPLRALIREDRRSYAKPKPVASVETIAALGKNGPGKRPRTKRKLHGTKETLPGVRVDVVLFELFDEARKLWGLSASETMERLLWLAFNRPKLSYETAEPKELKT